MNLWNLKYSKQRLEILQRTQAQKRHLISLIKAKSVVSTMNESFSKQSNPSHSKISRTKTQSPRNLEVIRTNNILVKKLGNIEKLKDEKCIKNSQCKFINITKSITNSHQQFFYVNKSMKQKIIDEENTKMFTRLIRTSPTIKRNEWIKDNIERKRFKENINRSKYIKPDYSIQASKLLKNKSTTKNYHLKAIKTLMSSTQSRLFTLKSTTRNIAR